MIGKVWVEDGCTACGLCEEACPEVFKVNDAAHVIAGADLAAHEVEILEAAESCPAEVIQYQ